MGDEIRVLHVDDDVEFCGVTAESLSAASDDVVVESASSGPAALERLDDDVDCIVSDYEMPEMDGIELLRRVREAHPALPFILFTGQGSEDVASTAISAGVDEYTRKRSDPRQFEVLANRIERLVARRRAEQSYREIFEKATVAMTVRDTETGDLLDVNRAYCDLLGYDRETALELTLDDITAGVDGYTAERARERVQRVTEEGTQSFEWLNERADGERIWVQVDLKLAEIEGRERVLASVQDVTDRKEREQALESQNERLEELASVLSHDLRSPLQVARGNAELAMETGDVSYLEDALEANERMNQLLDEVLTMARLSSDVEETTEVALETAARSCWTTVRTDDATLDAESDAAVEANRTRFEQLLDNLFRNAVEHSSTGSRTASQSGDAVEHGSTSSRQAENPVEHGPAGVTVRVGTTDDGFYVADDGPGIPPAEREAVFEAGYSEDGGTGLGLAIVEDIVEAHGWSVSVTESEDGGARFEFET